MDVKGITWIGNVYQKFETMCLEVEEAVCQDTVKYVENQVQTVGASVKKFYSDVIDDLLTPSLIDPDKVNSLSCTGVYKKPKMGIKEEPKRQLFEDRITATKVKNTYATPLDRSSNMDPAVPCHPVNSNDKLTPKSAVGCKSTGGIYKKSNLVIKRMPKNVTPDLPEIPKETIIAAKTPKIVSLPTVSLTKESCAAPTEKIIQLKLDPDAISYNSKETEGRTGIGNKEETEVKHIVETLLKPSNFVLADGVVACDTIELNEGRPSLGNEEGSKHIDFTDTSENLLNIFPSDTFSGPNEAKSNGNSYADVSTWNEDMHCFTYSDADECITRADTCISELGETDGWNIEAIYSEDDMEEFETAELSFHNNIVLEESCVMVDRDSLPSDSPKEPKQKSYKKKIRDAFSSKGKLIRKQYKQLAAQYEAANVSLHQQSTSSSLHASIPNPGVEKLKSTQLSEAEWEIL